MTKTQEALAAAELLIDDMIGTLRVVRINTDLDSEGAISVDINTAELALTQVRAALTAEKGGA